jgi:hypothetical protein
MREIVVDQAKADWGEGKEDKRESLTPFSLILSDWMGIQLPQEYSTSSIPLSDP